jgi:hypothetical protein
MACFPRSPAQKPADALTITSAVPERLFLKSIGFHWDDGKPAMAGSRRLLPAGRNEQAKFAALSDFESLR